MLKKIGLPPCNLYIFDLHPSLNMWAQNFIILPSVMLANFGLPPRLACHIIIYMKKKNYKGVIQEKILQGG
jgi:hypothetical protein